MCIYPCALIRSTGKIKNMTSDLDKLKKYATYSSVIAAIIIIIMKLAGWVLTNSLSIFASLTDSLLDAVTSMLNLLAVHYALKPADNEHRFGHHKAEDLAVFVQSAFFGASGIFLIIAAIKRAVYPIPLDYSYHGIVIMMGSIIVTICLITFQRYVIKKTGSDVIKADSLHYSIDLLSNIAVIISLIIVTIWDINIIDPLFAIIVAIFILHGSWELLCGAFDKLMDRELSEEKKQRIINIIRLHDVIKGFHDLKTRHAGNKVFIQFHLELDPNITLNKAHNISVEIEHKLLQEFEGAEIIIHQDPAGIDEHVEYIET
ncbi:Ferrous-iron efflux pump FieF [Rickettsiales bacterium Ac37b]|nr:Ferrous-iron efflux pump FieF [Rickettsiales bacterium Ac37b]